MKVSTILPTELGTAIQDAFVDVMARYDFDIISPLIYSTVLNITAMELDDFIVARVLHGMSPEEFVDLDCNPYLNETISYFESLITTEEEFVSLVDELMSDANRDVVCAASIICLDHRVGELYDKTAFFDKLYELIAKVVVEILDIANIAGIVDSITDRIGYLGHVSKAARVGSETLVVEFYDKEKT